MSSLKDKSANLESASVVTSQDEVSTTICEWSSYKEVRCKSKSNGKLCDKHAILIKDYKLLDPKNNEDCLTQTNVKIEPRSYYHLKMMMKKYNYDTISLDIHFPGGNVEEGNITSEDYIEMEDGTKYYYETHTRGEKKTKNIKILFINHCNNTPVISIGEHNYCKECYKKASTKLNYPKLDIIKENEEMEKGSKKLVKN